MLAAFEWVMYYPKAMRFPRLYTRGAALAALLGVLFTQLALALYVCPDFSGAKEFHQASHPRAPMQMAGDVRSAEMGTDCVKIDKESPNLCIQYNQTGSRSLDRGAVYVPLVLVVLYFAFILARPVRSVACLRFVPDLLKRDTAPPLSIQHCCFRI